MNTARHVGWLIGQRLTPGGEWKYFRSNFRLSTPLTVMVEYTHRRCWVEQAHEEAKRLAGWDQYQGRLWPGFHRHAAVVRLTYSFLIWRELREREQVRRHGRPRAAFPPSAGSPLPVADTIHRPVVNRLLEAALHEFIRRHQFLI